MHQSKRWVAAIGAVFLAACGQADGSASSSGAEAALGASSASPGAVFVLTNEAAENAVLAFDRGPDGQLVLAGRHPTGGSGTGAGLGSQGALALSADGRWLHAVDAGSDELTMFRVHGAALERVARTATGGDMPVSVTSHGDLVYVVHAGGAGGIAGFERDGQALHPIAGSVQALGGAAPAQISFDPLGRLLVVTEKATNSFSLYQVLADGSAGGPASFPSAGETPFGFAFASADVLVVSEAFGGRPGESALSSYRIEGDAIDPIDPVVGDGQTAACWVVIPPRGRHAYTTNTGSDNVSIYAVAPDGGLHVASAPAPTGAGSAPTDAAIARDGRWLYALDSGLGALSIFGIAADGSLEPAGGTSGLPPSTVGVAAR